MIFLNIISFNNFIYWYSFLFIIKSLYIYRVSHSSSSIQFDFVEFTTYVAVFLSDMYINITRMVVIIGRTRYAAELIDTEIMRAYNWFSLHDDRSVWYRKSRISTIRRYQLIQNMKELWIDTACIVEVRTDPYKRLCLYPLLHSYRTYTPSKIQHQKTSIYVYNLWLWEIINPSLLYFHNHVTWPPDRSLMRRLREAQFASSFL